MAAGWRPTMPDESTKSSELDTPLAVPGVLCVVPARPGAADGRAPSDRKTIRMGPGAGWMVPQGIGHWERELSFMARADMTTELARSLRATMPHEQIAPKRFPAASRAVASSPLLPIAGDLVDEVRRLGARVHTVGVDRVSSDFYYFAEGGGRPAVNVQANLIEVLAPSLESSSTNADIARLQEGLLDRLLSALSDGVVSELDVELADALPRLSRNATGLQGTDLETFDERARTLGERSARHEAAARRLAVALSDAGRRRQSTVRVPLFGEARSEVRPPLDVLVAGEMRKLPEWPEWIVTGALRDEPEPAWRAAAKSSPRFAEGLAAAKPGGVASGREAEGAGAAALAGASIAQNHVAENAVAAGAKAASPAAPASDPSAVTAAAPLPAVRARAASEPPPPSEPLLPAAKQAPVERPAPEATAPAQQDAGAPVIAPQAVVVLDERVVASQRETPVEPAAPAKEQPQRERAPEKAAASSERAGPREGAKARRKAEAKASAKADTKAGRKAAAKAAARAESRARGGEPPLDTGERTEKTAAAKVALARARGKKPTPATPEAKRSFAVFIVGLLALVAAVAYSGWRLWYASRLH